MSVDQDFFTTYTDRRESLNRMYCFLVLRPFVGRLIANHLSRLAVYLSKWTVVL